MANKLKALADTGLIEVEKSSRDDYSAFDVDLVFKLDIKTIPTPIDGAAFGHQLMLVVVRVEPEVKQPDLVLRHLMDLGVLVFTSEDPDLEAEVVCREEDNRDYWTSTAALRKVWATLLAELKEYGEIEIESPQQKTRRRLRYAITGMKYFNSFISPELIKVPAIYLSHESGRGSHAPDDPVKPLQLFKSKIFG